MLVPGTDADSDAMSIEALPDPPLLDLANVSVPQQLRRWRGPRRAYEAYVVDQLYSGAWRYAYCFSNHLSWFVSWLMSCVVTTWQRRHAATSLWKVSTCMSSMHLACRDGNTTHAVRPEWQWSSCVLG